METIERDVQLIANSHIEQNKHNPIVDNVGEMNAHFLSCYPEEGCGVVVNSKFIACDNVAKEPEDDFRIRRGDYLRHEQSGGIEAVMHSHTITGETHRFDHRTPSMADMAGQKSTAVPWGIVACEGENVTTALWFGLNVPPPIEGRMYVHNVYDCLTCACDYMKLNFDIDLPVFPRPMEWDRMNKNMITEGIDQSGFRRMPRSTPINELQHGDFILFKIQANYVNHVGVVTEDKMFWHQLMGRYTKKDHIAKWNDQIVMYLRHEDLE